MSYTQTTASRLSQLCGKRSFPDSPFAISAGFEEWANAYKGETPEELGRTYRAYALAHPHLYRLMTERPLARERLTPGVEERAAKPIVDAVGGDADAARAVWAFAHGMTILELSGRFPPGADLDPHHPADGDERAFHDPEGDARLALKPGIARHVEQVDLASLPAGVGDREGDRHLPLRHAVQ